MQKDTVNILAQRRSTFSTLRKYLEMRKLNLIPFLDLDLILREGRIQMDSVVHDLIVNPIALSSMLSYTCLFEDEARKLLYDYLDGKSVRELNSSFFKLPHSFDTTKLSEFSELESEYLICLRLLGLNALYRKKYKIDFVERSVQKMTNPAYDLNELFQTIRSGEPAYWSQQNYAILFECWYLANPHIEQLAQSNSLFAEAILYQHGFATNTSIHTMWNHYRHQLDKVKQEINRVIKSRSEGSEGGEKLQKLKALKLDFDLFVYLNNRFRRYYEWNPCEIAANAAGEIFVNAAINASSKSLGIIAPKVVAEARTNYGD